MIDRSTIDRIIDAADIVEVIQDFVLLKKRGANYLGLCPFHNEKTPSFTVSPSKGIFKCFGCGKAGNSVNFIMEHERLSYPEALRFLAAKYHIDVVEREMTPEEGARQNERESMMVLSQFASKNFQENLFQTEEGVAIGLSYFKERGFRQDTLKKFEVGYCMDKWDAFTQTAINAGYDKMYLIKTGLSIENENNMLFDRFRGRVIFPIHSLSGQILGFGGRVLKKDAKTAKYLNSPESEIYHKSRILYGIYHARRAIGQFEKCYLVEGYTDVMSLHEAGVENVVASSGTSLTREQVRLIKRFTPNITILYDGDEAGIKASMRGIDIVLEEGLNIKIVLLPEGEDPDSYSKKISNEDFIAFLGNNEVDFIKFKTNLLLKDSGDDPLEKANVIKEIVKSITVIPDTIPRTIYIKECSLLLDIPEEILYNEVNRLRRQKVFQDRNKYPDSKFLPVSPPEIKTRDVTQKGDLPSEKEIIRLLLKYGTVEYQRILNKEEGSEEIISVADHIVSEIVSDELDFENANFKQIFDEFKFAHEQGNIIEDLFFVKHGDPEISKISADLLSDSEPLSKIWSSKQTYVETEETKLLHIVDDVILKFKADKINSKIKELLEELKAAVAAGDEEKVLFLQRKDHELKQVKKIISKKMGNRILL
ncbi:MAG TPA: DNA primase [Bacteroidetes bacterium]|nr:DNA primase [Bacteroidota bacterium]